MIVKLVCCDQRNGEWCVVVFAKIWSDLLGTYVLICGEMGAFVGGSVILLLLRRVLFFLMNGGGDC